MIKALVLISLFGVEIPDCTQTIIEWPQLSQAQFELAACSCSMQGKELIKMESEFHATMQATNTYIPTAELDLMMDTVVQNLTNFKATTRRFDIVSNPVSIEPYLSMECAVRMQVLQCKHEGCDD